MKLFIALACLVVLTGCGKSTVTLDGKRFARAECKADLDKLRRATQGLDSYLKEVASQDIDPKTAYLAALHKDWNINLSSMSACGAHARTEFVSFMSKSVHAITLHNGDFYKSLSFDKRQEAEKNVLEYVREAREKTAKQLAALENL